METNTLRDFKIELLRQFKNLLFHMDQKFGDTEEFETIKMLFLTSAAGATFVYWKRGRDVEDVERMKGDLIPKRVKLTILNLNWDETVH